MALFGSNMSSEVGLRLLLCPVGSNVVMRTACCSVGIALPVYSTFKAIETRDQNEQQKWLLYWAAYGSFTVVEVFTDKFIYWVPYYYPVKFAFLVWLQLPSVDGARQLYTNYLRPFLLRHQGRLDQIVGFLYSEMAKFASNHQAEIQFLKALIMKILTSANEFARDATHPRHGHRHVSGAIEGPSSLPEHEPVTGAIEGPSSHLEHEHVAGAIEGPSRLEETSESENEE